MRQVSRQERKFLVDPVSAARLKQRLSTVMRQDAHNGNDGYRIRSLYFDTVHERDYVEKLFGTDPRRKIRLRLYDPSDDFALLECKQKQGEHQLKRSMQLNREESLRLIDGDVSWMLRRHEPFAAEVHALMVINGYRPKAIVEYRRWAFVAKENRIRVTFDSDIRATECNLNVFDERLCLHPVLDQFNVIVEVKYNGFLLSYIKDQLNSVSKRPISISKYCLSRDISMGFSF